MNDKTLSRRAMLAGGSGVLGLLGGAWLVESRTRGTSGGGPQSSEGTLAALEDAEDWSGWETWSGTVAVDEETSHTGTRSLRLHAAPGDDRAGASYRFRTPQDFSRRFPVVGLRWDPVPPYQATDVGLRLWDRDDREVIFGQFPSSSFKQEGRWLRVPVTYRPTVSDGEFDFGAVTRVDVYHYSGGGYPATFWVDDLSFVRSERERGVVMVHFDDAARSVYETAFPIMRRHDVPGTFNVIPRNVGRDGLVTLDQLHELDDAGWDVSAHPQFEDSLPEMGDDAVWTAFGRATAFLSDEGFTSSALAWPYNRWDAGTVTMAAEHFDVAFAGGSGLHLPPAQIETPLVVPRTGHGQFDGHRPRIDRAAERKGLVCLLYHDVGSDEISREQFTRIIEHVASASVDVVTATDVLEATG